MRIPKKVMAAGLALGLTAGVIAAGSAANAEPVAASYAIVGSDTLQESVNALTNGTAISGSTVRVTANGNPVGNFDAFGSHAIQAKPGGPVFGRPSGSGAGRDALRASISGNPYSVSTSPSIPAKVISGQVDIARSSSGPGSNANADGRLAYYPFGRDAVAYAYTGDSAALGNLTTAQIKAIYEAATPLTINGVQVTAIIPQPNSGTRQFFLQAIGVTTVGASVADGASNTTPENDASVLAGTTNTIIPFSAAAWIAQKNGAAGVNTIGAGVSLGNPNSIAPANGTTTLSPNSAFYSTSYGRDTYLIVEYARVNPADGKYDAKLAALMDRTRGQSLTNFGVAPSTAGAVKSRFGFLAPSSTAPIRAYVNG